MPRFPHVSPSISGMPGSVYSALAHRLSQYQGRVYPLHVGDTWMEPAHGCRMEDLKVAEHPGMHRYASPAGTHDLLAAIARRVTDRTGLATGTDEVLVTAGATGGLAALVGALVAPGDEVLIMAPFWPLIGGMVQCFHGVTVPVPVLGQLARPDALVAAFEQARTDRTAAIYLNTPNNPTGRIVPSASLRALVQWATEHDLWVIADEVYEDYVFEGVHTPTRPMAPERVFAAYSFSKAYGMAGNRCGYLVGPASGIAEVRKVSTHTFYSTPTAAQIAAVIALGPAGDAWVARARERYRALGNGAADRLGVERPGGSTFLFVDVADALDGSGLAGLLERCVARGLLVAPGPSFGPFPTHVRVCFTCAPPNVVEEGVHVLAELLGR